MAVCWDTERVDVDLPTLSVELLAVLHAFGQGDILQVRFSQVTYETYDRKNLVPNFATSIILHQAAASVTDDGKSNKKYPTFDDLALGWLGGGVASTAAAAVSWGRGLAVTVR